MISQELMLGDWVMLNPDLKEYYPFAGKSCMVIGLHDDDGAIKIEYDNGKYFWTDAEDDVIPIPLTPEILEKNGFVKQEDGYFRYFKSYDENYYFGFESISYLFERKTAKITKEHSQSGMQEKVEFTCEYLHELQHALRLCGIDKEIEL